MMFLSLITLRIIWWLLIGVLFIGFAITDGFDLGIACLYPLVAKNETEKRIVLNSIGPFWEGNQVWIILGAGAVFAAWPFVYAVAFSGAYFAVLLLLLTLGISRPVSFKYRSKVPNQQWRHFWDRIIFIGGFLPSLIFGVLVGNILTGLPFSFDNSLRISYSGSFLQLFSPFSAFCALTSLCMLMMHGGLYLAIKTNDPIKYRAIKWTKMTSLLLIILFALGGIWVAMFLPGYQVQGVINYAGFSNPINKTVIMQNGAWILNYYVYPWMLIAPALGFIGAAAVFVLCGIAIRLAFICSALAITGIIATVGFSMFPFILPSSLDFRSSLLVWDASSSQLTLMVMLFTVIIFMPLILVYTSWVYHALRGKVKKELIEDESNHIAY